MKMRQRTVDYYKRTNAVKACLYSSVDAMILEVTPLLFQDTILQTLIHTESPADSHRTFTFIRLSKVRSIAGELSLTVTEKYTTKFSVVLSTVLQGNVFRHCIHFPLEVIRSISNMLEKPLKE